MVGAYREIERRAPPSLASQLAVFVLGAAIVGAIGSGLITWAGHDELVGDVRALSRLHDNEIARLERKFTDTITELRDMDVRWHGCAERMARVEQTLDYLSRPGQGTQP
jgi:hypothetical protein